MQCHSAMPSKINKSFSYVQYGVKLTYGKKFEDGISGKHSTVVVAAESAPFGTHYVLHRENHTAASPNAYSSSSNKYQECQNVCQNAITNRSALTLLQEMH